MRYSFFRQGQSSQLPLSQSATWHSDPSRCQLHQDEGGQGREWEKLCPDPCLSVWGLESSSAMGAAMCGPVTGEDGGARALAKKDTSHGVPLGHGVELES